MVYVDNVTALEGRDKLKEIYGLCKDKGEALLTFVVEVVELSRDVVERERVNENQVRCINVLKRGLAVV